MIKQIKYNRTIESFLESLAIYEYLNNVYYLIAVPDGKHECLHINKDDMVCYIHTTVIRIAYNIEYDIKIHNSLLKHLEIDKAYTYKDWDGNEIEL